MKPLLSAGLRKYVTGMAVPSPLRNEAIGGGGMFPGPEMDAEAFVGASWLVLVGDAASLHAEARKTSANAKSEYRFIKGGVGGRRTSAVVSRGERDQHYRCFGRRAMRSFDGAASGREFRQPLPRKTNERLRFRVPSTPGVRHQLVGP